MGRNSRDEFSQVVKQALMLRVAGCCSRPECRRMTIAPDPDHAARFLNMGIAAHITAAAKNGPRYEASLTPDERKSAGNGIWLCAACAGMIDKNEGGEFSPELLRSWKARAEQEVSNASLLHAASIRPLWLDKIRTPHYINFPRVVHLSTSNVLSEETHSLFKRGFPEDRYILQNLHEVQMALRLLSIKTIDLAQILRPDRQVVEGLAISFYGACRTKNGGNRESKYIEDYSFDLSPLIYIEYYGYRYVFPYDPVWLTSSTAGSTMRAGSVKLAGIGIVKHVDHDEKMVIATPLTFGVPDLFGIFAK